MLYLVPVDPRLDLHGDIRAKPEAGRVEQPDLPALHVVGLTVVEDVVDAAVHGLVQVELPVSRQEHEARVPAEMHVLFFQ